MNALSVVSVFSGAGLGALLRWFLGDRLNPVFPTLPLGTLTANLLGGLLSTEPGHGETHHATTLIRALTHPAISRLGVTLPWIP
jgi:hypothetical protein